MERTMMDDVNAACDTMSLAELEALHAKVGRLIGEKHARRREELTNEFVAAFRALRKEFPEVEMPVYVNTYCDECNEYIGTHVDILELMEELFRLGN